MLIIALAGIFAWAGTMLGTFRHLAEWIIGLTDNGVLLLILIMLAVLVAGMLLDAISIYLIMMPILIPVMQHFEWNPVWFGILLAMNIAIGQFTPAGGGESDGDHGSCQDSLGAHTWLGAALCGGHVRRLGARRHLSKHRALAPHGAGL